MVRSPLLSIIIPTRNRQKYAISAISSILSISASELELVVQDNSDSDDLEEYIQRNIADRRLRYNHITTPLSFVDNFNAAVALASGKYICIIGDDDGINPEIIEATRWAEMNNIDALIPIISAIYIWPESGVPSKILKKPVLGGILTIRRFSGEVIKSEPEAELKKVMENGGLGYLETRIPRTYHGIIKYKCLEQVREKTGAFFGGLSPDIFSAVAVANFAKNVVAIDYPLTIDGTSKPSGSAQSAKGEHVGNLKDAPHFRYRGNYQWARIVPRFYSVETIWADSTVAAIKALGREDLLQDFNLPFLAAHSVIAHRGYASIILKDMWGYYRELNVNSLLRLAQFCYYMLLIPVLRLKRLTLKGFEVYVLEQRKRITGVNDTVEAAKMVTDYLRQNNKQFLDIISDDWQCEK